MKPIQATSCKDSQRAVQIQGLPTMIFVGLNPDQPAIRTEGLLPAATIKEIVANELNKPVSQ